MRFSPFGPLWAASLLLGAAGQAASGKKPASAGAAGSSAAYHLHRFAQTEGLAINITVFEKSDRIGGRSLTVNAFDDPLLPFELGASIFVKANHVLYNATLAFDLSFSRLTMVQEDAVTAIWDGEEFVFETTEATSWWWDAAKMWWRYGTAPYYVTKLVDKTVARFMKLYEPPYFPFRSLTARTHELGLVNITAVTGEQFLAQNKINPRFSREIIQAATRVNYASNLAHIHGLETMVSFCTDGAVSVQGGNWQIFQHMIEDSHAAIYRNTSVTSLTFAEKGDRPDSPPKRYLLSTETPSTTSDGSAARAAEQYPTAFDDVIIASPWQFSNIDASDVADMRIEEIPYTKLHVTLFASPHALHPDFFKLAPGATPPSSVYTTLAEEEKPGRGAKGVGRTGFYSISTLRTVTNPATQRREFVYKIFSPDVVTPAFLRDALGLDVPETFTGEGSPISWYHPHWFHSYPIVLPRVTFQDPVIGDGLYYTSGIESLISTMETSALMGMNVARLIVDEALGNSSGALSSDGQGGLASKKVADAVGEL
ncbi:Farnesylcysteine lyase [Escovopsis weberi]|uniref:Farnesylcysteine lyase n=1 Tax=Escovopsis weberi TaxID=150374 RepID=A0A0N0RT59_ESCWE|nr:Farnesylcysteine lyase [Escovopsis weberi]